MSINVLYKFIALSATLIILIVKNRTLILDERCYSFLIVISSVVIVISYIKILLSNRSNSPAAQGGMEKTSGDRILKAHIYLRILIFLSVSLFLYYGAIYHIRPLTRNCNFEFIMMLVAFLISITSLIVYKCAIRGKAAGAAIFSLIFAIVLLFSTDLVYLLLGKSFECYQRTLILEIEPEKESNVDLQWELNKVVNQVRDDLGYGRYYYDDCALNYDIKQNDGNGIGIIFTAKYLNGRNNDCPGYQNAFKAVEKRFEENHKVRWEGNGYKDEIKMKLQLLRWILILLTNMTIFVFSLSVTPKNKKNKI